ncbi:MAG: LLM class flavin-dependent oxidoreductase [Candidatus Caldarchaeum sp.]|nr:LLM class flavin-dependent oxidoreductase [Candidatus Caldarchaeum sp.]
MIAGSLIDGMRFDGLWVSDHYFNRSSFITLTLIALNTRRVVLGPAVVNPYTTHPAVIAQNVSTLQEVAKGRVRLALGAGDKLALGRIGVEREKPVEAVVNAVNLVRRFLTHSGRVDVYIGAQGERMLRASTEAADGVLVNWSSFEMLEKSARILSDNLAKTFHKAAYVITSVHEDEAKARKTAVPYAAYLMAGSSQKHLERMGIGEDFRKRVQQLLEMNRWDELYQVSTGSWVDEFAFWGSFKKLEEFSSAVLDMGYDEIVFAGPLGPRYLHALKTLSLICRRMRRERVGVG